jgi:hypothetical protein
MNFPLEYHKTVRPSIPASLALFGILSLPLLLVSSSPAQHNSFASGHAVNATPGAASQNYSAHVSANSGVSFSGRTRPSPNGPHGSIGPRRPTNGRGPYYYYPYLYAVPYPYPLDLSDNGPSDDDPDYQGGPTVFDRRGSGPASYIPPVSTSPDQDQAPNESQGEATADSNPGPELPQIPTVLVFKDGHQIEIENYAIVNQTLYDLTPGHPRKIALSDLDLQATEKQNDDRGITFELPSSSQAN